jgi:antitoxin CcdA
MMMQRVFDRSAPKKPTNLSINSHLLAEARQLKINLSATLEQALEQEIRAAQRDKWLAENKEGLEACNELAEKNGLFSDAYRMF